MFGSSSKVGGAIAGAVCIVAGAYLLQTQAAGSEGNWLETIAHGMGIYFIGKGIFIVTTVSAQIDTLRVLREHLHATSRAGPGS
jgi:hypothetical protein